MSDNSSLVATFKEKLRARSYGKSSYTNSRYVKENLYFNGIALKESLLNDYKNSDTYKRVLLNRDVRNYSNNNKCFQLDKGCFIYQKPSTYEDNDIIHRFEDMKIVNEFGVNSNDEHFLKTHSYNLKKNDREEIRNRLVGSYQTYNNRKSTKKSSLESRLQNGSSLQLCFMNDPSSDLELPVNENNIVRHTQINSTTDLKQGLIQANTRARAHMISDHRNCVISAVIKDSLSKVGAKLDNDRKRVSRHFLMRLNLAQLQVIVNDLHSFIEYLNESLVNLLLERDELHMAKDSMLVDIEDLKHVARVLY